MADQITCMTKADTQANLRQYDGLLTRGQLQEARASLMAKRAQLAQEGTTREVDARLQGAIAGVDLALGTLKYFT